MSKIGKIYKTLTPYYDKEAKRTKFKSRPALIIGEPNGFDRDYTVLPVSTIKQERYRDPKYDFFVEKASYPLIHLNEDSYIRTGKRTTINEISIDDEIGNLKESYPEKYLEVLELVEEFDKELIDKAI